MIRILQRIVSRLSDATPTSPTSIKGQRDERDGKKQEKPKYTGRSRPGRQEDCKVSSSASGSSISVSPDSGGARVCAGAVVDDDDNHDRDSHSRSASDTNRHDLRQLDGHESWRGVFHLLEASEGAEHD